MTAKAHIDKLIDEVIAREGEYSNHPADRGGPTRWGVTERVARAHGYKGDMRHFPRDAAVAIYRELYWRRPGFDAVELIYERVAEELLDTGINMGTKVASGFLQRALNALNREGNDYPDVPVDGDVGPLTLAALRGYKARRGAAGETVLMRAIEGLQAERYMTLAEQRPANEAFLYGWLANRVGLS